MGDFVYMVRFPEPEDEVYLFARAEDADAYAGIFLGAEVTEEPLFDASFVDETRDEIEADDPQPEEPTHA